MNRAAEAVLVLAALVAAPLAAQEIGAPERTVVGLHFQGNRVLDDFTLSTVLATSNSTWTYQYGITRWLPIGTRQTFDEIEFRRDVVRLQLFYRQNGYYDVRVDTTVRRSGGMVDVTFRIEEGLPTLVDSVVVGGLEAPLRPYDFVRRLPLAAGRPFNRFLFEASADTLLQLLRNRGYPFAQVFRNYAVDRASRSARVEFDVYTGTRARIGEIVIAGNERVGDGTVRQALAMREGEWFSQDAVFASQRTLYQRDLFRYASVGFAPESLVGGADSLVRLRVLVAEARPVSLRLGAGYGTIDCLRTSSNLVVRNFLGQARQLDLSGRVTKIGVGRPLDFGGAGDAICPELRNDAFSDRLNYQAGITLTQPSVLLRRSTLAISVFAERRSEFDAYLYQTVGASIALRMGLGGRKPSVSLAYRLSRDRTEAEPAVDCVFFDICDPSATAIFERPIRQASLAASVVSTTTDNPLEPTNGRVLSVELTTARALVGSQVRFDRMVVEGVRYVPLRHRRVLAFRLRGGVLDAGFGRFADSTFRYVPPSERFYAGGPTTVRGFGRNEMGPVVYVADSLRITTVGTASDTTYVNLRLSPSGSAALVLGNVELRLPTGLFANRLSVAFFADGGRLWQQRGERLVPGRFYLTPGAGMIIATPLGPMRLDIAYNGYDRQAGPLYVIQGTQLVPVDDAFTRPAGSSLWSRLQWHFSVGLGF